MAQFLWRCDTKTKDESSEEDEDQLGQEGHHITLVQLKAIRVKYEMLQDEHDVQELDEPTFVSMLQAVLPKDFTRRELRRLFRHVDANANGSVDWDEFSSFVLQSGQQRKQGQGRNMTYIKPERADGQRRTAYRNPDHHSGPTTAILCSSRGGKYYTCGRDGYVKVWQSGTLELEQSLYCGGRWATDAVFLKNESRLAVCSMDKIVSVFDLNYHERKGVPPYARLMRAFVGKQAMNGKSGGKVLSMPDEKKTTYVGGQTQGVLDVTQKKPIQRGGEPQHVEMCTLEDFNDFAMCIATHDRYTCLGLKTGCLNLYDFNSTAKMIPCEASFQLHNGPISSMRSAQYIDAVITAGWDDTIQLLSLERQKIIRTLGGTERGEREKSIFAMDWSERHRLLATAAAERTILMWNPYIPKPVYKLEGHNQQLVTVYFNPVYDQLFSLSLDKAIKIWDLRTMKCLQTISNEEMSLNSEDALSTLAFDKNRGALVCVSGCPTVYPLKASLAKFPPEPVYLGHQNPILDVKGGLLGDQQVIFTCDSERVCVWSAATGARMYSWYAHNSGDYSDRVVAIDTDENSRRVILAFPDKVKIVNCTNGQVLSELVLVGEGDLPSVDGREVTAVLYLFGKDGRQVLACAGSSIVVWEDGSSKAAKGFTRYSLHCDVAKSIHERNRCVDDTTVLTCCCKVERADGQAATIALGTDRNMVAIYSTTREALVYTLGECNKTVSIEELSYNKAWDALLVCTENRVSIVGMKQRATLFTLSHSRLSPATGAIHSAHATEDGRRIVTSDEDGTVYIWHIDPSAYAVADLAPSGSGTPPPLPARGYGTSFANGMPTHSNSPFDLASPLHASTSADVTIGVTPPTQATPQNTLSGSPIIVSRNSKKDEPVASHLGCTCALQRRMHQGPAAAVLIVEAPSLDDMEECMSPGRSPTPQLPDRPLQLFSGGLDCSVSTMLLETGEFVGVLGWDAKYHLDDATTFANPRDFDPTVVSRPNLSVAAPSSMLKERKPKSPKAKGGKVAPPRSPRTPARKRQGLSLHIGEPSSPQHSASPRHASPRATRSSSRCVRTPQSPNKSVTFDVQGSGSPAEPGSPTAEPTFTLPPLPRRGLTAAAHEKKVLLRTVQAKKPAFTMESNIRTSELDIPDLPVLRATDTERARPKRFRKHRKDVGLRLGGKRPKAPEGMGYSESEVDWKVGPSADELRFGEVRVPHMEDVDIHSPDALLRQTRAERSEEAAQHPLALIQRAHPRERSPSPPPAPAPITNTPSPACYPLTPIPPAAALSATERRRPARPLLASLSHDADDEMSPSSPGKASSPVPSDGGFSARAKKRNTIHALTATFPESMDSSMVGVGARQVMRLMQRGRKQDWALRANSKLRCPQVDLNIRVPKRKLHRRALPATLP
eukprot:TRINITY_DN5765_c0_g1_i1.p1 TRINITY_DN5765_c0_g1~~TRINITY_DN5765_c0_g1_i1.p1  ORF type:complete len:1429 (+),score=429.72 TRINITY_DN5765_c0_g1_i1:89-4288(+)